MQMVKATLAANPNNSVIGFRDNSSAIRWGDPRMTLAELCLHTCSLHSHLHEPESHLVSLTDYQGSAAATLLDAS